MPEHQASETRQRWNARYRETERVPKPARVLVENQHLLPPAGRGLDLACGLGGNALLLAARGFDTWAWDISDVAVERLRDAVQERGMSLRAEVRDVSAHPPAADSFDVIVVSRFLDRAIAAALMQALKPGGLLFYQTLTRQALGVTGPQNPAYLLEPQELLRLFHPLRILVYRDEGDVGDMRRGLRYEAMLVGRR